MSSACLFFENESTEFTVSYVILKENVYNSWPPWRRIDLQGFLATSRHRRSCNLLFFFFTLLILKETISTSSKLACSFGKVLLLLLLYAKLNKKARSWRFSTHMWSRHCSYICIMGVHLASFHSSWFSCLCQWSGMVQTFLASGMEILEPGLAPWMICGKHWVEAHIHQISKIVPRRWCDVVLLSLEFNFCCIKNGEEKKKKGTVSLGSSPFEGFFRFYFVLGFFGFFFTLQLYESDGSSRVLRIMSCFRVFQEQCCRLWSSIWSQMTSNCCFSVLTDPEVLSNRYLHMAQTVFKVLHLHWRIQSSPRIAARHVPAV